VINEIPITDPVKIEEPMPVMPWYPENFLWAIEGDTLTLPREDAVRLITWVHQLGLWRTKDLPLWLKYYDILVDPAPEVDGWLNIPKK